MAQMSRIKWDPIYSVHVEILDAQHKELYAIVNHIIDVFENGSGDFLSVIHDLTKYLSVHFHAEHLVMMNANYPNFLKHSKEHQQFTEKVEEFLQDYQKGDEDLGLKMVVFLKEWVRDHTTKLDMEYAEHLLKKAEKLKKIQK
jgi:hemerythrin-like metal-binding protein